MERMARARRGAFKVGIVIAAIVALAVFVLGAPPWTMIPISLAGATGYAEMCSRVDRRLGRQ